MNPTFAETSISGGSSTSDGSFSESLKKQTSAWNRIISKNFKSIRMSFSQKDGIYSGMISASRSYYITLNKMEIKWLGGRLQEATAIGSKSSQGIFCARRSLEYKISKRSTRPDKMNTRKLHIKQIIRETGRPEVRRETTISGADRIDFIVESLKEFNIKIDGEKFVNIE